MLCQDVAACVSEPESSPENITANATSPTTVAVMWGEVPAMDQNGDIIMYEVMYTPLETFGGTVEGDTVNVSGSNLSVVLTGLEEYVNYSISVRAFTDVGAGPYSVAVIVLIQQDSKCNIIFVYLL